MSRELTAGMVAEVTASKLRPVIFYEGEFASGTLRMWSGVGAITWNSSSWAGAGSLLTVSEMTETADVRAAGFTCTLSGVSSAIIAVALAEGRLGKPGKVWLGMMDGDGAVIADPYLAFSGRLDVPSIDDSGETTAVSISYESRLIDLQRSRERRWTHEDQQIDFPGDLGFAFVSSMPDQVLEW